MVIFFNGSPLCFLFVCFFCICCTVWSCMRRLGRGFPRVKLVEAHPPPVVFLLTVPRRLLFCVFSLFVCQWLQMWNSSCHYLFSVSPAFGASGRLCFVIVTFPGYLHSYFNLAQRLYKTFFMLNSNEQEISLGHKNKNTNKYNCFSCSTQLSMLS